MMVQNYVCDFTLSHNTYFYFKKNKESNTTKIN